MKYRQGILIYLVAAILQPFLNNVLPVGVAPNLFLCLTVVFLFIFDDNLMGLIFGAVGFLLQDILYGPFVGIGMLSVVLVGIIIILCREFVNIENIISLILFAVVSTAVFYTFYWGISTLLGGTYSYLYAMNSIKWQAVSNIVFEGILYMLFVRKVIRHRRDRYFR